MIQMRIVLQEALVTHPVALLAVRVPLPAPEAVPKDPVALQAAEALGVVELQRKTQIFDLFLKQFAGIRLPFP